MIRRENKSPVLEMVVEHPAVAHPAIGYLRGLFDEDDLIFFQLIHSTRTFIGKDGKPQAETKLVGLVSVKDAATPQYIAELEKFQSDGWNVYVCMNPCPPHTKTRTERLITTIRTLFLDVDKTKGQGADALRLIQEAVSGNLIPSPTSILESSPGNYHIAWAVDDFSWDEAKAALPALASQLGGDPSATDLNRVLRMPGFRNLKSHHNGFVCHLVSNTFGETPYTKDQFKIPVVVKKSKTTTAAATEELESIAAYIEKNAEEAKFELSSREDYQNGFSWIIECPWAGLHETGGSSAMIMLASHLSRYGVSSFSVLQLQYLIAGIWVLGPPVVCFLISYTSAQFEVEARPDISVKFKWGRFAIPSF
jgi:RepB DNA-primase from phage plasmid